MLILRRGSEKGIWVGIVWMFKVNTRWTRMGFCFFRVLSVWGEISGLCDYLARSLLLFLTTYLPALSSLCLPLLAFQGFETIPWFVGLH